MKKMFAIVLIILGLTGCQEKKYMVTFDTAGGTLLDSVMIEHGKTIEDILLPEKEGYLFVGWEKNGIMYNDKTPITEDISLVARWIEVPDLSKEYKVVFDVNNKSSEQIIKSKELVKRPKDPSLKYYKFVGWYLGQELYDFSKPVTKDLYLVAKFERKILTISFELDGGSGLTETKIEAGGKIMKPSVPTKLGYKFVGWYYLGKSYNFNSIVEKDITLKAVWRPISYVTVKYVTNGGTPIKSEIILEGGKAPKPQDPVKEGYKFIEWQYNGIEYDFNLPVEETIELIAIYQEEVLSDGS